MLMPLGSPVPTYKPSALPIMTIAALQRVTTSAGGSSNIGTPPTPLPTLGCTRMVDSPAAGLADRAGSNRSSGLSSVVEVGRASPVHRRSPLPPPPRRVYSACFRSAGKSGRHRRHAALKAPEMAIANGAFVRLRARWLDEECETPHADLHSTAGHAAARTPGMGSCQRPLAQPPQDRPPHRLRLHGDGRPRLVGRLRG